MQVRYVEDLASHDDPELCVGVREAVGEALTGEHAGGAIEPRKVFSPGRRRCGEKRKATRAGAPWRAPARPCVVRDLLARVEAICTGTGRSTGWPSGLVRPAGPHREGQGPKPMMHGRGKSDPPIVPGKPPNKAGRPAAEAVEGRGGAKGNAGQQSTRQTQSWASVSQALDRIRQAARRDRRPVHRAPAPCDRRPAAVGVSPAEARGGTGRGRAHVARVRGGPRGEPRDLHGRVQRGAYRAIAVAATVHPEAGRPAAAARHRRAGGQDRPARRRWRC